MFCDIALSNEKKFNEKFVGKIVFTPEKIREKISSSWQSSVRKKKWECLAAPSLYQVELN